MYPKRKESIHGVAPALRETEVMLNDQTDQSSKNDNGAIMGKTMANVDDHRDITLLSLTPQEDRVVLEAPITDKINSERATSWWWY